MSFVFPPGGSTSTWQYRLGDSRSPTGPSGSTTFSLHGTAPAHLEFMPGSALGIAGPSATIAAVHRIFALARAFEEALWLATEMAAADEAEPPDPNIWESAWRFAVGDQGSAPIPLITPLQLGGVSVEWHEHGLNIELRFRGVTDTFTLVEDIRGELHDFAKRDPGLKEASLALRTLATRVA
ncbi:MAG: hypothetical protein ACREFO_21205 [Acetobacteraceae bacterium]